MRAKYDLHRQMKNVDGTVLWYAKAAVDDTGRYGTMLRNHYWKDPALQPLMPFIDDKAPKAPRSVKPLWTPDGYVLFWSAPKAKQWGDEAHQYVVYQFAKGDKVDLNDASKIVAITRQPWYRLPYAGGKQKYTYVVTALDRMSNESKGKKKSVRL